MPIAEIKDGLGSIMKSFEIDGRYFPILPAVIADDLHITKLPDILCRDDDVMILTYPKAGTHWSWEIVNMLYTGQGEISKRQKEETMLECSTIDSMSAILPVRILNTHLTPEFYPKDLIKKKCKIIFVQRNPKDAYVSFFHHTRKINMYEYEGEWNGFFENVMTGKHEYGSWFEYTKKWEEFFAQHPDIPLHRMYFEDMKLDVQTEIEKVAKFLNLPCSPSYRETVAEKCGFQVMKNAKKMPQEVLNMVFKDGVNGMFRKGIVGDWKNHFTVAQNERFDEEYKKQMKGFTFKSEQYM